MNPPRASIPRNRTTLGTDLGVALRTALLGALLSALGACAGGPFPVTPTGAPVWAGDPVVRTRFGAVRGLEDRYGTWVWKAVPYARPPLGDLRWKAPQEPEPWTGVRTRYSFSRPAVQFRPLTGGLRGTEDCLYLNIWRPRSGEAGLPVYVWIHGGGNSIGSADMLPDYLGRRLAAGGNLVFVSVNYRLGPMGWFTHPVLREGQSPEDDSGNYGTLDLIQALRWIRGNIAGFGGDPGVVTIAGESAGAINVLSLLLAPAAQGLFHRAVAQSGLAVTSSLGQGEHRARQVILRLLQRRGRAEGPRQAEEVLDSLSAGELRAFLRNLPAREILRAYTPGRAGMIDNPMLLADGAVLPSDGFARLQHGDYPSKVPVMIGSNREELKTFLFLAGSPPWRSELYALAARYGSERWRADGVDGVARPLSSHADQPPVYAYLFSWGAPDEQGRSPLPGSWGRRLGAFHSLEVPFFLGTATAHDSMLGGLLFTEANRPGREALSAVMQGYLTAFLRAGDPNYRPAGGAPVGAKLPPWLAWSNAPGAPKTLLLDVRGDQPELRMLEEEVTRERIEAALQAELPPEQREAVLRILDRPLVGTGEQR